MNHQQALALLQQLQQQHPQAFRRNFLFYSLLKTKGVLDDIKEIIPWILAAMIFIGTASSLAHHLSSIWDNLNAFQYMGCAILLIMLVMRLYAPYVMWQLKYSSDSLYEYLKNTPLKLTILILLQAFNLVVIESSILQYVLFFFAMIFGFVRLYKENLFLDSSTPEQHYVLQQIRRATLWSHQQRRKLAQKLKRQTHNTALKEQHAYFDALYQHLKAYENKICLMYKHADLESYLDQQD